MRANVYVPVRAWGYTCLWRHGRLVARGSVVSGLRAPVYLVNVSQCHGLGVGVGVRVRVACVRARVVCVPCDRHGPFGSSACLSLVRANSVTHRPSATAATCAWALRVGTVCLLPAHSRSLRSGCTSSDADRRNWSPASHDLTSGNDPHGTGSPHR